jgi:hypothetical protein
MEWWSGGVVESWSRGVVESWSRGVVESWSRGVVESWSRGVVESWSRGVVEWSAGVFLGRWRLISPLEKLDSGNFRSCRWRSIR